MASKFDCAPKLTLFIEPIIHSDSLCDELMIPTEFVKKYGGDVLPDTAFLKVPNGAEWKVNLEKRNNNGDDQVWFAKGWKQFAEYYSLFDGRLVVFGYNHSTCRFHVLIFDFTTSLEIQYPSNNAATTLSSETNFEQGSSCGTKRKNYDDSVLSGLLQQCKRKRVIEEGQNQKVENAFNSQEKDLPHSITEFEGQSIAANTEELRKKRVAIKTETTEITCSGNEAFGISNTFQLPPRNPKFTKRKISEVAASDNFNSQNAFFKIIIGKSHTQRLPVWFVKEYLEAGVHVAELKVEERCWSVKLICSGKPTHHCYFSRGWTSFLRQNHLRIGDVCSFELINSDTDDDKMIMRVVLSRIPQGRS